MSRSFRKAKNHKGNFLGRPVIWKGDRFFCLRHPKQYVQCMRELGDLDEPPIRKKSIPPSSNEDQFAFGRIGNHKK